MGQAFFPNGADRDLLGTLSDAGWNPVWVRAGYYFAIRQPDGEAALTFVEGDIYTGLQRPQS